MIKSLLFVGLGGAIGSICRFSIQRFANEPQFPYGTMIINLLGCLVIGILWGVIIKLNQAETIKLLLMTGFCGGFTTFSAFTLESLQLLMSNKWLPFFVYLFVSVIGGLLATFIGYKITS